MPLQKTMCKKTIIFLATSILCLAKCEFVLGRYSQIRNVMITLHWIALKMGKVISYYKIILVTITSHIGLQ